MAKIWIVTSGDYSAYAIDAVFSTEELAQAYVRHLTGPEEWADYHVEEYELDVPREEWPGAWLVRVLRDGSVFSEEWSDGSSPRDRPVHFDAMTTYPEHWVGCGPTPEHARRSAEQLRREMLALPFLEADDT